MMDRQRRSDKERAGSLPEELENGLKGLHRAIRKSILYPQGHPFRVKAASEVYELIQGILSDQNSHSLTAIENKIYIDQHEMDADENRYVASDRIHADLARRFRHRGIRSVVFFRGMELWEMEKFLDITTMIAQEAIALGGAGELLRSVDDVSHIEIVDIEYENIQFEMYDGQEDSMDTEEILLLYLRGGCEDLEDPAYAYLLSLLEEPDQMARLIEDCIDYDGVSEPDIADLIHCMENLIDVGEQFTEQEKRSFLRKILEAVLQMESPVKNALFSSPDDNGVLDSLLSSLSIDEIVQSVLEESATEEPSIPLRRMFDELLAPDQSQWIGMPEKWLAELESSIQAGAVEKGQEDVFRNTIAPLLEEAFVELESNRLEYQQWELDDLLERGHLPEPGQVATSSAVLTDLFVTEGEVISSASVLLEVMESETDPVDYSGIVSQLEERARSLITGPYDTIDIQNECFNTVFRIIDSLSLHAHDGGAKPLQMQERARKAIANICTGAVTDQLLSTLLASEDPRQQTLERFTQQVGEKTIKPLVKNLLETQSQYKRQMLTNILISMGSIAIPELHRRMRQTQWGEEIKVIIPILCEIGGTEDPDSLSDKLNHPNPQVRRTAIIDLAVSKDPRAAEMVWSKIRDRNEEEFIREFAVAVLGEVRDEKTVDELVKITKGRNPGLRREAIFALGNIGGEKSMSILSDLLKQKRRILGKRREDVQLYAIEALGRMGTRQAIEILIEVSKRRKKGALKAACDKALRSRYQAFGN